MKIEIENPDPFLEQLKKVYIKMDAAYNNAAAHYGFECRGCPDNCCLTRFFHHTVLEYAYVKKGFFLLKPEIQEDVKKSASDVCRKTSELQKENKEIRLMCPLNFKGLCQIYEYRPMICRLHGIAHELHWSGKITYGPGCGAFTDHTKGMNYYKFDRTPFYIEIADLENELKKRAGIASKIKMTIAEMIETF
ncbi:Uncharacterized protein dnl_16860 [Desulfonema limicola]|uniref:YkgJ family cysteine cluster protein n=1 Tax=Desulfonema limicola TaxID=45656 RepID=A0A975B5Z9_9BACT|nr:hypothetical protein [Desulfonema limicola]QTA79416.1 Uncharacterized protein dnl_16860 [Desulfonema limicola]